LRQVFSCSPFSASILSKPRLVKHTAGPICGSFLSRDLRCFRKSRGPLAFEGWRPILIGTMLINFAPDDYSVVVKNRAKHSKPWRWLIYRAGRNSPVDQSSVYFETMTMAHRAGKEALRLFLAKHYA
jgi:hypothetical protein